MQVQIETTVLDGVSVGIVADVGREPCGARYAEVLRLVSRDPAHPTREIELQMEPSDWDALEDLAREYCN